MEELLAGPSEARRNELWLQVTGAAKQLQANPGYYARILQARLPLKTIFTKQIERDLARTFPSDTFFERTETQQALRNILTAYSWRNPNVGYCQGMNCFVGRFFSYGFTEEETFWLLAQMVEQYLPLDYYSVMTGVLVDNKTFERLLQTKLPKVMRFLRSREIDTSYFCVQWFVCLFASHFTKPVLARIWDHFFAKGASFLFELALALTWLCRKQAAKVKEFHEVVKYIETHSRSVTDPETILKLTKKSKFQVKKKSLRLIQDYFRLAVKRDLMSASVPQYIGDGSSDDVCINEDDCKQRSLRSSSFFIFASENIQLRDDYLSDENLPRYFNAESLREQKGALLLGRRSHRCELERHHFSSMARLEDPAYGGTFFNTTEFDL